MTEVRVLSADLTQRLLASLKDAHDALLLHASETSKDAIRTDLNELFNEIATLPTYTLAMKGEL